MSELGSRFQEIGMWQAGEDLPRPAQGDSRIAPTETVEVGGTAGWYMAGVPRHPTGFQPSLE